MLCEAVLGEDGGAYDDAGEVVVGTGASSSFRCGGGCGFAVGCGRGEADRAVEALQEEENGEQLGHAGDWIADERGEAGVEDCEQQEWVDMAVGLAVLRWEEVDGLEAVGVFGG